MRDQVQRIKRIAWREVEVFTHRPVFLFCMIVAPIVCVIFFTSLMRAGLPTKMPAAIVDEDDTKITRTIVRVIDAFEDTDIRYHYKTFGEAREAMQRGDIYAFFHIPKGTTTEAVSNRQPRISFYTNDAYLVPANLMFKDMKTASELIGLALTRETLYGKGTPEYEIMGILQPIVIETHPLNNPTLDYSVYLSNMLVPGILILMIMLTTTYTIGIEWKHETQKTWYAMANNSSAVALTGKLLPQTVIYTLMMLFMDIWFFKFLAFPCNCGIATMFLLSVLTVLASQGFGIFLFGLMAGNMRLTMCICSLWGILSFSLAGFTYPVTAMNDFMHALAAWFPLRHYYLVYVNQALNGYPLSYVYPSVAVLVGFCAMPIIVLPIYRRAFLTYKYLP